MLDRCELRARDFRLERRVGAGGRPPASHRRRPAFGPRSTRARKRSSDQPAHNSRPPKRLLWDLDVRIRGQSSLGQGLCCSVMVGCPVRGECAVAAMTRQPNPSTAQASPTHSFAARRKRAMPRTTARGQAATHTGLQAVPWALKASYSRSCQERGIELPTFSLAAKSHDRAVAWLR